MAQLQTNVNKTFRGIAVVVAILGIAMVCLIPKSGETAISYYSPSYYSPTYYSPSYYSPSYYSPTYWYPTSYFYRLNWNLVGHDLNGVSLNGDFIEDATIESISFQSATHDKYTISSVKLVGSALRATMDFHMKGKKWRFPAGPKYLKGTQFEANLDDGSTLPIRIEDIKKEKSFGKRGTYYYHVTYETDEGWLPLCGEDDNGDPVLAIGLEGAWDYTEGTDTGGSKIDDSGLFTFGCSGFVLTKCVEMGYAPWNKFWKCSKEEGCSVESLASHHQACTRMLRADFCGNGISHTIDGVTINFYDNISIRKDTEDWTFEAEWDEDGAICASRGRLASDAPECLEALYDPTCGDKSHLEDGTLIFSESVPEALTVF